MFEDLSLNEARHVLTDFFEIHTEAPFKNASRRAKQILDAIEVGEVVSLGTVPSLKVGESVIAFIPEDCDPDNVYLLKKEAEKKGYSKKLRVKSQA